MVATSSEKQNPLESLNFHNNSSTRVEADGKFWWALIVETAWRRHAWVAPFQTFSRQPTKDRK